MTLFEVACAVEALPTVSDAVASVAPDGVGNPEVAIALTAFDDAYQATEDDLRQERATLIALLHETAAQLGWAARSPPIKAAITTFGTRCQATAAAGRTAAEVAAMQALLVQEAQKGAGVAIEMWRKADLFSGRHDHGSDTRRDELEQQLRGLAQYTLAGAYALLTDLSPVICAELRRARNQLPQPAVSCHGEP